MALSTRCDFRLVILLSAAAATAGFPGCGPQGPDLGPYGHVSGRITHQGNPVSQATITFTCPDSGQVATADLQPDGTYTMSHSGRKGLPVGKYYVYLLPNLPKLKEGETDFSRERSQYNPDVGPDIPMKFRDESNSGIVAMVEEGENRVDFDTSGSESEE
jgi:hypothetical protein